MQVTQTSFTVAQYCGQMQEKSIVVNRHYQRSPRVWPPAARSYLIDTVLSGYPIPKLSLYQKTDVKTRRTINEIVDGQQRSMAIFDFFNDNLRLSGRGQWTGLNYSGLEEVDQQRFLGYQLSVDVFVGASEPEIRQVFQRMNSYQVLLNKQEQRHATWQGTFKWFIVALTERYSQALKDIGVMTDRNLVRMADAALFTEIIYALENGIESASDAKLDRLYKTHDEHFDERHYGNLVDRVLGDILEMTDLHDGPLMKSYQFYSLFLALAHINHGPIRSLQELYPIPNRERVSRDEQIFRLSQLAGALTDADSDEIKQDFGPFIEASSKGTNRIAQRQTRFRWMSTALSDQPFPQ